MTNILILSLIFSLDLYEIDADQDVMLYTLIDSENTITIES